MSITPVPPVAELPPPPSPTNRDGFDAMAYAWSMGLPAFGESLVEVAQTSHDNAVESRGSAVAAHASEAAADVSRGAAQLAQFAAESASHASMWQHGAMYDEGEVTWSPATFLSYRSRTGGVSTIDPSVDSVRWLQLTGVVGSDPSGLPVRVTSWRLPSGISVGSVAILGAIDLDSGRVCFIFGGGLGATYLYCAVVYDEMLNAWGPVVPFFSPPSACSINSIRVDSGRVLVLAHQSGSTALTARVLSVSGTAIDVGDPVAKVASVNTPILNVFINVGNTFVFSQSGFVYGIVVDGTVPVFGAAAALDSGDDTPVLLQKIDDSHFFAQCYRSGYEVVCPYSVAGSVLTKGVPATTPAAGGGSRSAAVRLPSGRFAFSYANTRIFGCVFDVSDNVATMSVVQLGATAYTFGSFSMLANGRLLVQTSNTSVNLLRDASGVAAAGIELVVSIRDQSISSGLPFVGAGDDWVATATQSQATPTVSVIDVAGENPITRLQQSLYVGAVASASIGGPVRGSKSSFVFFGISVAASYGAPLVCQFADDGRLIALRPPLGLPPGAGRRVHDAYWFGAGASQIQITRVEVE